MELVDLENQRTTGDVMLKKVSLHGANNLLLMALKNLTYWCFI